MMKCNSLLCSLLVSATLCARAQAADYTLRRLQEENRPPNPSPAMTRPPKTTQAPNPSRTRPPKTPGPTRNLDSQPPTTAAPVAPETPSISQTVCASDDFSTLCGYLETTGLFSILNGSGTYTLFAPNNAAFDLASVADLTDDEIVGLLLFHISPSILTNNDLMEIAPGDVETLVAGLPIVVSIGAEGEVLLNGRFRIASPDIRASNGIIQVVDGILVPSTLSPTSEPTEVVTSAPTEEVVTISPTTSPVVARVDTMAPTSSPLAQEADTTTPTSSPIAQEVTTLTPTSTPISPATTAPTPKPSKSPTASPVSRATLSPNNHMSFTDIGSMSSSMSVVLSKSGKTSKKRKNDPFGKSISMRINRRKDR